MLPNPPEGLRHWRLADAPALGAAWSDERVRLWNPPPASADPASWISRCDERWSLRLSLDFVIDVDGDVGGEIGLRNFTDDPARAELGVWVADGHRRRGLGAGAVARIAAWAPEVVGLEQLWCRTRPDNEAAIGLFTAAGWRPLGERDGYRIWSS